MRSKCRHPILTVDVSPELLERGFEHGGTAWRWSNVYHTQGPQRTEITQPENSTYPCFHCQLPWGMWWPEIFTMLQYSPERCLAVGLGHRRRPHADELGRSRCDTHWKDPFSPKDRGSRDIHSWGDYSFRWVNKNTEISIDSKKISEYWEFLPVERPINLDGRDSPSNYRKKDLGH